MPSTNNHLHFAHFLLCFMFFCFCLIIFLIIVYPSLLFVLWGSFALFTKSSRYTKWGSCNWIQFVKRLRLRYFLVFTLVTSQSSIFFIYFVCLCVCFVVILFCSRCRVVTVTSCRWEMIWVERLQRDFIVSFERLEYPLRCGNPLKQQILLVCVCVLYCCVSVCVSVRCCYSQQKLLFAPLTVRAESRMIRIRRVR